MKPLTLALIRQRYAADGGAERFIGRALEALKGQDVHITLITREWQQVEGVDVIVVNPFYIGRLWRDWSFARAVRGVLKQHSFDLVQAHERIAGCDIYRAGDGVHREWLVQRARALPAWRRVLQALNPYHVYVKWAEKRVFTSQCLKAVICNSKMVREEIRRWFGVAEEKLHVVYNGVSREQFQPALRRYRAEIRERHGIPLAAKLLLFVGSGFERKGVGGLIEAMCELPANTFLLVVGRDRKLGGYRRRTRKLGLGQRVIFAGSRPDVKPYYGAADAFALPTLYDPFPNVVIEALACGLPVVTSTKSGAAEFIAPGKNGYVCDALDRAALVRALRTLPADFSAAACAAVEPLDLGRMGVVLSELYRRLARPRV